MFETSHQFYVHCSLEEFIHMLDECLKTYHQESTYESIFSLIQRAERIDLLEYMIKKSEFPPEYFNKMLNESLMIGYVKSVELLLSLGYIANHAYPNLLNNFWHHNSVETLKKLQLQGFDIRHDNDKLFRSAIEKNHWDGMDYLCSQGIRFEEQWPSVMYWATIYDLDGCKTIINYLKKHNVNLHHDNDVMLRAYLSKDNIHMVEFIMNIDSYYITKDFAEFFILKDNLKVFKLFLKQLKKQQSHIADYHDNIIRAILHHDAYDILKYCHLKNSRCFLNNNSLLNTLAYSSEYQNKCSAYLIQQQKKTLEQNLSHQAQSSSSHKI